MISAFTALPPDGRSFDNLRIGFAAPEGENVFHALRFSRGGKARELRVVAVQDRRPRPHADENFRLGIGDGIERGKKFQMHRLDGGDQRVFGRTCCESGPSSPAWFMPISNTP